MALTHVPTSTLTNLTRLELEELRRADAETLGRAVTKGDDGTIVGGVGLGSVFREPFTSGPSVHLDDIYALPPPGSPGGGLGSTTQTSATPSETVQWYGPTYIFDGTGQTGTTTSLTDYTIVIDFAAAGVVAGDFVLFKPSAGAGANGHAVAQVATTPLGGATTLALNNILTMAGGTALAVDGQYYPYVIVRKTACRLFAMPGSGALNAEQAFVFVQPASTLHTTANPTLTQIETDRVRNLVPPQYNAATVDRADAIFAATPTSLDKLGYRVVLYPDDGSGAPDFTKPILTATPRINTSMPFSEQRMTVDYRAGILRLSCAPDNGSDINPAGVLSPLGRINLWAMFWSFDQSLTGGSARGLFAQRSDETVVRAPARIVYDAGVPGWKIGSTSNINEFYVKALDVSEDPLVGTEFGTLDTGTTRPRYFRYETGTNVWRMRATGDALDTNNKFGEVELGGRTKLTVGDGSAPMQAPGDYNPTAQLGTSTAMGFRNVEDPIRSAISASFNGGYATVHLRKGRYYTEESIHVAPGITIEGEGPASRVFARSSTGTDTKSIFKVGPNTSWGVYDPTWTGSAVAPTQFAFSSSTKIEGYDLVWNPTRRVWGIVQADCSTNAVWFNEVKVDGTTVLPGLGIDIKNDARLLYSSTSPGAESHTPAHYPRIAYHEAQDEYAVVWVEKDPSLNGPICKVQIVDVTNNDPITFTTRFTTSTQAALGVFNGSTFSDHPSIAVDNSNASANYTIALSYWGFSAAWTTSLSCATIRLASNLNNIATANESETTLNIVSSTDVAEDNFGGFLWAWSIRNHPIYTNTDGVVTTVGTPGDTFEDAIFTGVTTFTAANIEPGDRFLYLGATGRPGGGDGVVQVVTGTVLTIVADDPATPFQLTAGTPITWAVVPRTTICTKRFYAGGSIGSKQNIIFANPASSNYRLEIREPDFVRLSRGGDNWLLAYQAFDSTAFLSQDSVKNFDNGRDTSLIDNAGLTLKDRSPYREHIATCAAVLGDYGGISFPMAGDDILAPGGAFDEHAARDLNVSTRSLGGRDPLLVAPNGVFAVTSPQRLVSARNFFHKWTATDCMSLIPDVTWTGQDWVVVSPSQHEVRSVTGKVTVAGGPTYYLSDASFYFGADATMANGAYLRRTVTPGTDQIYVASLGFFFDITAIVTEHTIQITPVAGAPGATVDGVEWVLTRPQALGLAAGIKNPGFRVSVEGRLIANTVYTTFADEPVEGSTTPRRTELMVRKTITSDGLNTPATLIDGYNDPSFSQAAIWGDVSYRGVAVGAPKGCASNNDTLQESPKVAIAWGESMYGFIDREVREGAPILNQTNFFRQSFGPYRVGFRNLSLMGANNAGAAGPLKKISQEHVFTRHGNPATSAGGFATDGFRNCFVAPIVTSFDETESLTHIRFPSATQAYYTDAKGSGALAIRGPATLEIPEYGLGTDYMNDLFASLPNPTGSPTNDLVMARSKPSSPQVLWDGSRFVAAWTETNSAPSTATDLNNYGIVCLGAFPGGEDQFAQDQILTGDTDFLAKVSEFAVVSVGNQNEDAVSPRSVFAASLAHSGRTYAVLWTGGQNPSDVTDLGGSAIGVVIFNGTGALSSGNNFVIDTNDKRGHYQDGKILWDGKQYVAVWRQNNNGTGAGELYYSIIPETGFGTHSQLIASAGSLTTAAGPTPVAGIGTVTGSVVSGTACIDISSNPTPVKPGDLVHVDHIVLFGGGDDTTYSGWWVVKDYDPSTSLIHLHYNIAATPPWNGLAAATHTVVGAIISMSQGSDASLQNFNGNPNQPVTGTLYRPQRLGLNSFSSTELFLTNFDRLDGFVYNEVDDEYTVLLRKTAGNIGITTWKRGTFQAAPEKPFSLGAACSTAALAWNGRNYLVTYNNTTTDDIFYYLLSPRLSIEASGTVATKATVIGNGAGQVPGPGYGTVRSSSLVQPRLTNLVTTWNNRLNRWIISGSWLWYREISGGTTNTQINAVQLPGGTLDVQLWPMGRSVTWAPGFEDLPQVGCRLIGVRTGAANIEHVFSPTVKSISAPGVVTLDTHLSELSADALSNWGVPPYGVSPTPGLRIGVVCREDVVCWTLGYAAPAVQLVDADDVFFDGVEFASGYVDVEERHANLARPTYQAGGVSFGKPSTERLRPNHVNHLLLTPATKTPTTTFTNVRSMTKARHGQGASPVLPGRNGRR